MNFDGDTVPSDFDNENLGEYCGITTEDAPISLQAHLIPADITNINIDTYAITA